MADNSQRPEPLEAYGAIPQPDSPFDLNQKPAPFPDPPLTRKKLLFIVGSVVLAVILISGVAYGFWSLGRHSKVSNNGATTSTRSSSTSSSPSAAATPQAGSLQLDPNKDYGNKYANGVLPVGDGNYTTDVVKKGYVYACSTYAQNLSSDKGGASTRGPWFTNSNTFYDINRKVHVSGNVTWNGSFKDEVSGTNRVITSNDLPNHPTGVFPIARSDAAYSYDRNPNSISSQSLSYTLPLNPTFGSPNCMGGEVGIMLTGVALFNAFDAGGRDAGAWEVQDACSGHPQSSGEYHYHTLSSCITNTNVSTVLGFALDGFPITGPKVGTNNILTTSDLDECHGITSQITLDGKKVTTYHYVMTQDFPYSASCFRAKAIQTQPSSGQTGQQSGSQVPPGDGPPPRQ